MMQRRAVLGALGVAVAGGAGYYFSRPQAPGQTLIDLGAAQAEDKSGNKAAGAPDATPPIPDMTIGDPDAKVHVIEYASFTCPHCAHFHADVWPKLKKTYIDTGKVRFTLREVYFDKFGLWAAMLARCGGEMRYFGITDIIFDTQADWLAGGDPAKATANLKKIGLTAGLSAEQIDACMQDGDKAKALVAAYQKNATADGIEGTPSFIIDGKKYSNMGYDEFAKILDDELAKQG